MSSSGSAEERSIRINGHCDEVAMCLFNMNCGIGNNLKNTDCVDPMQGRCQKFPGNCFAELLPFVEIRMGSDG